MPPFELQSSGLAVVAEPHIERLEHGITERQLEPDNFSSVLTGAEILVKIMTSSFLHHDANMLFQIFPPLLFVKLSRLHWTVRQNLSDFKRACGIIVITQPSYHITDSPQSFYFFKLNGFQ